MSIQSIRDNSKGVMAKIIVGAIAVTFALFGVDAIVGFSSSETEVAKINGEKITDVDLARSTELLRRQVLAQAGANIDPALLDEQLLQSQALESLIRRELLSQDANALNLSVSSARIDREIVNSPAFQIGGVFDGNAYQSALRNVGLTPLDYKNQLASELLIQQKRIGLGFSSFLTAREIDEMARLDRQTRNIAYLSINAAEVEAGVTVSDEEAQLYYDENSVSFTTEETVLVDYLELKRSDFYDRVTVAESDIADRYQQEVASYQEREERQASHILVEVNDDVSMSDAVTKLEELKAQLDAGADFAVLAKENSDDLGSADAGGDLGFNSRGAFVGAFEDALFELEKGQTSGVVETEFGAHLIKLIDIRTAEAPSLDDIRDELEREVRHAEAEVLFVDTAEELRNDAFSAGDLEEPAQNAGLAIQTSVAFTRNDGTGIAENQMVRRAAFSDEVLQDEENSDLIEITRDHVVVVRLNEYRPAAVQSFAQVKEDIVQILKAKKIAEVTEAQGQALIARLEAGESTGDIVANSALEWQIEDKVARSNTELDGALLKTVFGMPKPAVGAKTIEGLQLANGDYRVIVLTLVNDNNAVDLTAQERVVLGRMVANEIGNLDYAEYQASLRDSAEISIRERE